MFAIAKHVCFISAVSFDAKNSKHLIHRLVATAFCNREDDCNVIDHIDRNPANNNYENLRWTSTSGNGRNASKRKDNTSGTSGVIYDKKGYWEANTSQSKNLVTIKLNN